MAAAAEGGGGPAADESGGPVWRGQLALPGMAPFGAEALAPEGRELWDVVPAAVQHIGRTEGVALNRCPSPPPNPMPTLPLTLPRATPATFRA